MFLKQFFVLFILVVCGQSLSFSSFAVEREPDALTADEAALKKKKLLRKRLLLRKLKEKRARLEEESQKEEAQDRKFSLHDLNPVVRYTFTSDINEQTDALDGSSALSLAMSYVTENHISIFSGLSVAYETVGSSVFRPSDNEEFFKLSDLYIGAGYQAKVKRPLALNFGGSLGIPTSDRSRFEGYRAIASFNGSLNHFMPKYKNLTTGVSGSFDYIFNTFDFSPTSGSTQPESRGAFAATVAYKLPYGFRYIGSVWSRLTLFVDNSTLTRFGNSHTLFWTHDNISAFLSYSNSDTPERGATDFWFIDEYRKIFSIGLVIRAKRPQVLGKRSKARPFNRSVFEED